MLSIAVIPAQAFPMYERLLSGVTELCGVAFRAADEPDPRLYCGALLLNACSKDAAGYGRRGIRTLGFVGGRTTSPGSGSTEICFSASPSVSPIFQGARLCDAELLLRGGLIPDPADEIIAHRGDDVLWLRNTTGAAVDIVAAELPTLAEGQRLYSLFCDTTWFALLPLLQFARELSGWTPPPARACFMFDDPNLHWSSYGYVRYNSLAAHADRHDYHVAFATVPLDHWYSHKPVVRLFQRNRHRLSLLVHGNDHTYRELHVARAPVALAAQALVRVRAVEAKTGLSIARVMAAPHGACSESMANALLQTGFEAACISRGSLLSHNRDVPWPVAIGMQPAAFLGDGLPIVPRFGMHAESDVSARLAVFLGQPIIPIGHHEDLRQGLAALERLAASINAFGGVRWTDLSTIVRTSYQWRRVGGELRVKLYSRVVDVEVPTGVRTLTVERGWEGQEPADQVVLESPLSPAPLTLGDSPASIAVAPGDRLRISVIPRHRVDPATIALPRTSVRALVRRNLCEVRDRLRPTFERLLKTAQPSRP